jgi:rubrerythrin
MGARGSRPTEYVCEYCGYQGRDDRPVDQVQCPMCGEPVTPLGPH